MNPDQFVLGEPNLHDGQLIGVAVSDKALSLSCRAVDGTLYELRLDGVIDLRADNFREGNTILDVFVYPEADCPVGVLEFIDSSSRRAVVGHTVGSIGEAADRKVLHVVPTYGCELVALSSGRLTILRNG